MLPHMVTGELPCADGQHGRRVLASWLQAGQQRRGLTSYHGCGFG